MTSQLCKQAQHATDHISAGDAFAVLYSCGTWTRWEFLTPWMQPYMSVLSIAWSAAVRDVLSLSRLLAKVFSMSTVSALIFGMQVLAAVFVSWRLAAMENFCRWRSVDNFTHSLIPSLYYYYYYVLLSVYYCLLLVLMFIMSLIGLVLIKFLLIEQSPKN